MAVLDKVLLRLRHATTTGMQIEAFDSFRGWAILGVFLHHAYSGYKFDNAFPGGKALDFALWSGHAGAWLFFFISGFLLFLPWGRAYYEKKDMPSLGSYFKRRAFRIVPAYYLFILIFIVLIERSFITTAQGRWDALTSLAFLHFSAPHTEGVINYVFWSVEVEVQFYLLLPFMASWFFGRRCLVALPVFIAVPVAARWLIHAYLYHGPDSISGINSLFSGNILLSLGAFGFAMAFANLWLWAKYNNKAPESRVLMDVLGFAGLAVFAALMYSRYAAGPYFQEKYHLFRLAWFPLLHLSIGSVACSVIWGGFLRKVIVNPVIDYVGVVSYSVYLWHPAVIQGLAKIPGLGGAQGSLPSFLLFASVSLVACLVIATLSYAFVEKPFLKLARRSRR